VVAHLKGIPAVVVNEVIEPASLRQAMYHMLTASMKGMVALSGLEAMSNGIQFVINEDVSLVKWGKQRLPKLKVCGIFIAANPASGVLSRPRFCFMAV